MERTEHCLVARLNLKPNLSELHPYLLRTKTWKILIFSTYLLQTRLNSYLFTFMKQKWQESPLRSLVLWGSRHCLGLWHSPVLCVKAAFFTHTNSLRVSRLVVKDSSPGRGSREGCPVPAVLLEVQKYSCPSYVD